MPSFNDIEKKLRIAGKGYDIIQEIFPDSDQLVEVYLTLFSQLEKGDSLEFNVETTVNDRLGIRYPTIYINLYYDHRTLLGRVASLSPEATGQSTLVYNSNLYANIDPHLYKSVKNRSNLKK